MWMVNKKIHLNLFFTRKMVETQCIVVYICKSSEYQFKQRLLGKFKGTGLCDDTFLI